MNSKSEQIEEAIKLERLHNTADVSKETIKTAEIGNIKPDEAIEVGTSPTLRDLNLACSRTNGVLNKQMMDDEAITRRDITRPKNWRKELTRNVTI